MILTTKSEVLVENFKHQSYVMVSDHGRYQLRAIELGVEHRGFIELRSGLSEGEEIVRSGQSQLWPWLRQDGLSELV